MIQADHCSGCKSAVESNPMHPKYVNKLQGIRAVHNLECGEKGDINESVGIVCYMMHRLCAPVTHRNPTRQCPLE